MNFRTNQRICEVCWHPIATWQKPEYVDNKVYHALCRKRELMNMTPQFPHESSIDDDETKTKPTTMTLVETRTGIDRFRSGSACYQIIKLLEKHTILTKDELESKVNIARGNRRLSHPQSFDNALKRTIRLGAVKAGSGQKIMVAIGGHQETVTAYGYYLNKVCHVIEPMLTLVKNKPTYQNEKEDQG